MDVRETIKKAEHQRTDAFKLWCWRRLLRVPWIARQLIGKDPDVGKDGKQNKRETEDEMAGWRHRFSGHGLGQGLADDEGQRGLPCGSS